MRYAIRYVILLSVSTLGTFSFASAGVLDPAANFITPQDFGAVCDNTTDDANAFQAALTYAGKNRKRLHIPQCNYVLSRQIIMTMPVDITADSSSNLRFTNMSSCGILIDLRKKEANFGLNSIQLGGLYAPAVDATFAFPGYPNNWRVSDRAHCDGVAVQGGSRLDISIKYLLGFKSGVSLEATYDPKNGARAPHNINVEINTADILEYGVRIEGGSAQAGTMAAIYIKANTIFAKYPVYFDTMSNGVGQVNIEVTGQAFTNEVGGACVFGKGNNLITSSISVMWCYAGYSNIDSPLGTPKFLQLPYLAGTSDANGQIIDGNGTDGYWGSNYNKISIGVAVDQANSPGGYNPKKISSGRFRNSGRNKIDFPFSEY